MFFPNRAVEIILGAWGSSLSKSADDQGRTACRVLADAWQATRLADRLPSRHALLPEHLPTWILPHLFVMAVGPDGHLVYRLIGTALVDLYGVDCTGRPVPCPQSDHRFAALLEAPYAAIRSGRLQWDRGRYVGPTQRWADDTIEYEQVVCPLSDNGEAVDRLIGAFVRLPLTEDRPT